MDPLSLHMRMMCSYVTMEYQLVGLQKKYMDKYFDDSASNISFFFEGKENGLFCKAVLFYLNDPS
jgi:hypothetical protein